MGASRMTARDRREQEDGRAMGASRRTARERREQDDGARCEKRRSKTKTRTKTKPSYERKTKTPTLERSSSLPLVGLAHSARIELAISKNANQKGEPGKRNFYSCSSGSFLNEKMLRRPVQHHPDASLAGS